MHELFAAGTFEVGCNYWASNAGTAMWSQWDEGAVRRDFADMASVGMTVLRVFPLWPDFQPIHLLRGGHGHPREVRFGEEPLPETELGRAGVSETMMQRFGVMADIAKAHDIRLVVGLLTGWMSGRRFTPPALDGLNLFRDAFALRWQERFVRAFVRYFKGHPAIAAWDLGNECNCLSPADSADEAAAWSALIANTIRAADPSRPVVSGMHSLQPDRSSTWNIHDQGELTDVLTTHPYPLFTPHCDKNHLLSPLSVMHATAETRMYGDISGKPAIAEETGTLGPCIAGDKVSGEYLRSVLLSLWAHDCRAMMWWCGFDQNLLTHAPYDWIGLERELGVFRTDRTLKPVGLELKAFVEWQKTLPFDRLPAPVADAVCILTPGKEGWAAAYGAFTLAAQAGLTIRFQTADQPLQDARLYLVPSVDGDAALSRRQWDGLLAKVEAGADLYLSIHETTLSPMNTVFGCELQSRYTHPRGGFSLTLPGTDGQEPVTLRLKTNYRHDLVATTAEVLAADETGMPVFLKNMYGKGRVWLLTAPLESGSVSTPGAFDRENAEPYWMVYRRVAKELLAEKVVVVDSPALGVTLHPMDDGGMVVMIVNYTDRPAESVCVVRNGWRIGQTLRGALPVKGATDATGYAVSVGANDGIMFRMTRA